MLHRAYDEGRKSDRGMVQSNQFLKLKIKKQPLSRINARLLKHPLCALKAGDYQTKLFWRYNVTDSLSGYSQGQEVIPVHSHPQL